MSMNNRVLMLPPKIIHPMSVPIAQERSALAQVLRTVTFAQGQSLLSPSRGPTPLRGGPLTLPQNSASAFGPMGPRPSGPVVPMLGSAPLPMFQPAVAPKMRPLIPMAIKELDAQEQEETKAPEEEQATSAAEAAPEGSAPSPPRRSTIRPSRRPRPSRHSGPKSTGRRPRRRPRRGVPMRPQRALEQVREAVGVDDGAVAKDTAEKLSQLTRSMMMARGL